MKPRHHLRLLGIATLVWAAFLLGGWPDYYRQYSTGFMVGFDLAAAVGIAWVVRRVLAGVRPARRRSFSLWLAFWFTVPLAFYDWLVCGVWLGHGLRFVVLYWYLSAFYVIPWILFPWLAHRSAGSTAPAGNPS